MIETLDLSRLQVGYQDDLHFLTLTSTHNKPFQIHVLSHNGISESFLL